MKYIPILAIEVATLGTNNCTRYFSERDVTDRADVISGDVTGPDDNESICEALQ